MRALPIGLLALLLSSTPALADVADGGSSDGGGAADGGGDGGDDDGGDDEEDDDDGCGDDDGATTGASLGLGAFLLFGLRRRRQ